MQYSLMQHNEETCCWDHLRSCTMDNFCLSWG